MNVSNRPAFNPTRLVPWLMAAVTLVLALALLPPLMHSDSGLQIRVSRQGNALPDGFYVYQRLNEQGIHIKSITPDRNTLVIRFDSQEQSTAAERVLRQILPEGFDIAQLAPSSAGKDWLSRITIRT